MKLLFTGITLFTICFISYSQKTTSAPVIVLFDTDKSNLNLKNKEYLKHTLDEITIPYITSIKLSGHTDNSASEEYNKALSQRRVKSVYTYLQSLGIPSDIMILSHFGENRPKQLNNSDKAKEQNRRVEVVITYDLPMEEIDIPPPPKKKVVPKVDCTYDTTLIFPQGTQITLNICDYNEVKDCLKFTEYNTGESLRNSNLTTVTDGGIPLISGGMFDIELCKEIDVTISIPQGNISCNGDPDFTLWESTPQGAWSSMSGKVKSIRRKGRQYLRTVVSRSMSCNFDAVPSLPPKKMRVQVPLGFRLKEAKLSYDAPLSLIPPQKMRKRKAIFLSNCPCTEPLIYLEIKNKKGEKNMINFVPLNDYKKREAFGDCKGDRVIKKVLFFKIREKRLYRKYRIQKKDMRP